MNDIPTDKSKLSQEQAEKLLRSLLHKQGSWVDWGKACMQLLAAGYNTQTIFEQTGFQGSQQNLIVVAAQVYDSLVEADASPETLDYFQGPRSDVLYEFRILNQSQRLEAAQLAHTKQLDVDEAKKVARAYKDFSRLSQLPPGFTPTPGDAVAYQCWKAAKQKKDLAQRARLIAEGLKFAESDSARATVEKLLNDFSVTPSRSAPLLPLYRLEAEEELPRIVPLTNANNGADFLAVAKMALEEPFRWVRYSGSGRLVPIPGWQAVLKAVDPVALVYPSDRFPTPLEGKSESVIVVIDRASTDWDANSYFLIEREQQLEITWFESTPDVAILGQLVLVLRPKKILDEGNLTQPWQMDD